MPEILGEAEPRKQCVPRPEPGNEGNRTRDRRRVLGRAGSGLAGRFADGAPPRVVDDPPRRVTLEPADAAFSLQIPPGLEDDVGEGGLCEDRQPGDAGVRKEVGGFVFADALAGAGHAQYSRRGGASQAVRSQAGAWERGERCRRRGTAILANAICSSAAGVARARVTSVFRTDARKVFLRCTRAVAMSAPPRPVGRA